MGTVDVTPSTLTSSPTFGFEGEGPGDGATLATADDVQESVFDGLRWTHRRGVEPLLESLPASAWGEPERCGWQRVKHNARREVWRAVLDGRSFHLKYYFRGSWGRLLRGLFLEPACRAEWDCGLFALRAGIPAVRPVACAANLRRGSQPCALLVTESVEPTESLADFWLRLSSDEDVGRRRADVAQLCDVLAKMIARSHQAGFEHLDMHAANILVQTVAPRRYQTVLVDLQSARRGVALGDRAVVRNLAQLNQWFRRHSSVADRLRFLRAYLRWRNEFENQFEHGRALTLSFSELVHALRIAAGRHAHRLWARRDRRAGRDGRYFARVRPGGGWRGLVVVRCKHRSAESRASQLVFDCAWWCKELREPLRWFEGPAAEACKTSHSGLVRRALLQYGGDSVPVIVKRPRARNWRRRLVQLFSSRGMRGWRMGHALLHRDLPTARPLAVLERRLGPLVLDNLLITEAIPGAVDLEAFLQREHAALSPEAWVNLKRDLVRLLVRQLRRLGERGFEHRDCKASNILVVQHPELKTLFIDMDGLRHGGELTRRRALRPLVRLHVSLIGIPGLTRTDRVRFLKAYFARYGVPADSWRAVWPALSEAGMKKSRAKEARRAWKLRQYGRE